MKRVLIANRGEIACRVIAACRGLGMDAIAVFSDADRTARHVRLADEGHHIGPSRVDRSYLNVEAVLEAARNAGADAIHPGYGLLSENAAFAEAVQRAGFTWIGPEPATIAAMGDKGRARALAADSGVPVLPGSPRFAEAAADDIAAHGAATGFPLLVKAAGGGGGIGMRRVDRPEDLGAVVEATSAMAARAFGNADRLPRTLRADGTAHRSAGLRLRRRPGGPPLRARMLGPAALPEGDRGGTVAGG